MLLLLTKNLKWRSWSKMLDVLPPPPKSSISNISLISLSLVRFAKFIRPLDCLDLHGVNRRMRDDLMPKLESLLADIIQEHKQYKLDIESSGQEFIPKDWTVLLSLQDAADNNLSDISIMALLTDLVAAGIDNMKGAVEWAMAEVIQNPPVMQKAQEEIQDAIGTERLLRPSDVPGLPYMHAILKEVLRLHPTGPLGVPHFNPTEAVLAGYRIPKGSTVLINIWAIGRDPKHWLDPEDFRPERFQGTEIKVVGQEAQLEMIPFSAGRRMCPGHPVAVRFIPFAVASLIHAFDWSLPPDQNSVDLMEKGGTIASKLASELTAVASPRLSCKSLYERGIQLPQSLTLIANANRFPEPLAPIFLWFWDLNQSNLWYLPGGSRSCLACDFPKNEAAIIRSRRTRTASHIFGINPMEDVKNPSSTSLQEDTTYGYTSFLGHTTTRSTKVMIKLAD
ncbi:cytochrome P450 98A1-like [Selaginella moellendorffii]|uniref:cytochrome P450 98A1-like n=1 Tax=Selaginella moellendorffii TaxID=88036 RepID=UPI000D1CF682|nr:cytochrome P450 98A1-like [Selaginella moellendorffii]|eukprot:XP_024537911.1 cytochrome P450 98A1-like [Selaginella moellendorffii]